MHFRSAMNVSDLLIEPYDDRAAIYAVLPVGNENGFEDVFLCRHYRGENVLLSALIEVHGVLFISRISIRRCRANFTTMPMKMPAKTRIASATAPHNGARMIQSGHR